MFGPFILVAIYRPGSRNTCEQFFAEFASLLESLATYKCQFYVVGDLNVHLERPDDVASRKLLQILNEFDLVQRVTEPTHDLGGLLDVVIGPRDSEPCRITVDETGLSDHLLVRWSTRTVCPPPEYKVVKRRDWSGFKRDLFDTRLEESALCLPVAPGKSASDLAECYDTVISGILDDLAPVVERTVRVRAFCPFYDK